MIDYILQNYIHLIINSLIQITTVLILFLVLSIVVYKNNHVTRHNFLFLGLLLMILCPIISSQLNIFKIHIPLELHSTHINNSPIIKSEFDNTADLKSNSKVVTNDNSEIKPMEKNGNISNITIPSNTLIITEKYRSIDKNISLSKIAILLWFMGFLFFTLKTLIGFIKIRRLIINSTPLLNREILKNDDSAISSLKIKSQPQVLISQHTGSPFVTGIINPKIVIPNILIEYFDADSFKSILYHELAHIKRKDIAKGFFQIFIQNILWFHPLIYLYNREMNFSREEVCDNYSLKHHQPKCYASILTTLAESQINKNNFSGVNSMVSSKSELFDRVKNILNPKRSISVRMKPIDLLSSSLILLISIFIIGSLQLVEADEKKQNEMTRVAEQDILVQRVTLDFSHTTSINEIKNILIKNYKLDIKLHDSLKSIKNISLQPFSLHAKDMPLKEVLTWIKSTLNIDYTLINNQIIFCSSSMKDNIDINYFSEAYSLSYFLALDNSAKQNNNDSSLNIENYRELIIDKIGGDSWDENFGKSIEILGDKLLVTHNKETQKNIRNFLSELENISREENNSKFAPTYNKNENLIDKSIQESLKKKVSFKFANKHFMDVLEEISKSNNLSIAYLLDSNKTFETLSHEKINLEADDNELSKILNELLKSYSLEAQIINGAFFISSSNYFEKTLTLERYNVKLICKNESCTADTIKEIIVSKINRSSWDSKNGSSIISNDGHLLVQTNHKTHELIREFLKELLAGKVNIKLPGKPN